MGVNFQFEPSSVGARRRRRSRSCGVQSRIKGSLLAGGGGERRQQAGAGTQGTIIWWRESQSVCVCVWKVVEVSVWR